jgi:asparagine synthetase B (glutamine-hydrolysing)
MFYGYCNTQFCASSIKNQVEQQGFSAAEVPPNTAVVFKRTKKEIILEKSSTITLFDLSQTVNNFDRVFENFERSVLERYNTKTIVPLSSGMDSGAIAACLHFQNKIAAYSSRVGHENKDILTDRYKILSAENYIFNEVSYQTIKNTNHLKFDFKDSQNTQVAWEIGKYAKNLKIRYLLSGTGADEIYSDYGHNGIKLREHSLFGGKFPANLQPIWPWCHRPVLPLKTCVIVEDYVYGLFGIDTRNPYLDIRLIQSWLSTTVELKNKEYKSWQQLYLLEKKFPFNTDKKCLPIPKEIRKQMLLKNLCT